MANLPVIHIDGLRELKKDLRTLDDRAGKDAMKVAHKKLASRVVDLALPRVPVRTGALKASVRGLGSVSDATGKAGGAKVPHAAAIHWGVGARAGLRGPHNIKARPFLFDAMERIDSEAVDEYADAIRRIVERIW